MGPFVHALLIHTARATFNFSYFFEKMVFDAPLPFTTCTISYSLKFKGKNEHFIGHGISNNRRDDLKLDKKHAQAFNRWTQGQMLLL